MASPLSEILGILGQSGGQTMGGDLALTQESPSNLSELFTGKPKEGSFFSKPAGRAVGSLLSVIGTGGLGALLGLLGSPENRGLGAARGAAMGAGTGAMMDIGQRRSASQAPLIEQKMQQLQDNSRLDRELKLKIAQIAAGRGESPLDTMLLKLLLNDQNKNQDGTQPMVPATDNSNAQDNKLTQDAFNKTFNIQSSPNQIKTNQPNIEAKTFGPKSSEISKNYNFYDLNGPVDDLDAWNKWLYSPDEDEYEDEEIY